MRTRLSLILALVVLLALTGCSTSSQIERRLSDLPGVVSASADNDDDDLPFGHGEVWVTVEMATDATADQVLAVFDELHDEVDGGGVQGIEVRMAGPKTVTLATGAGVQVSEDLVGDLVTAHRDAEVLLYERVAFPSLLYVRVHLATEDFDHVVVAADRYGEAGSPDHLSVIAGRYRLFLDRPDDPARLEARTRFVQRVDGEFPLTGAEVPSHGPLELFIARKHRDALRALLAEDPEATGLGPVVVRIANIPGS